MEEEAKTSESKMSKKQFWIRFSIWFALAVAVPFSYIAVEYGLFGTKEQHTTLSGWGVVALIFVAIMLISIFRQTMKGLPYGSMARQCITGYTALIPLFFAILLIHSIKNSMESFERFLIIVLVCEAIAVPINPLQRWAMENHIDLAKRSLTDVLKSVFGKGEK